MRGSESHVGLLLACMTALLSAKQTFLSSRLGVEAARNGRKSFCMEAGCRRRATFKSEASALEGNLTCCYFCATHRPERSVPSRSTAQRCRFRRNNDETGETETCTRWPSYGKPDGKKPEYCCVHAPEGSVNMKKRVCCIDGCKRTGTFGSSDDYRIYCVQHKDITHSDLRSRLLSQSAELRTDVVCKGVKSWLTALSTEQTTI
eukprot:754871-Hanusia_phi.AAC.1